MHLEVPETVRYGYEIAVRDRERQRRAIEWVDQWPGHCRRCMAAGYQMQFEPLADGDFPGLSLQACRCIRSGHCPRCGGPWLSDVEEFDDELGVCCPHCHWQSDQPDIRPFGIDPETAKNDDDLLSAGLLTAGIVIRGFNDRGESAGPIAAIRGPSVKAPGPAGPDDEAG